MNWSDLQTVYNYIIYPKDLNILSDKSYGNIDNGSWSGSNWTCFI